MYFFLGMGNYQLQTLFRTINIVLYIVDVIDTTFWPVIVSGLHHLEQLLTILIFYLLLLFVLARLVFDYFENLSKCRHSYSASAASKNLKKNDYAEELFFMFIIFLLNLDIPILQCCIRLMTDMESNVNSRQSVYNNNFKSNSLLGNQLTWNTRVAASHLSWTVFKSTVCLIRANKNLTTGRTR